MGAATPRIVENVLGLAVCGFVAGAILLVRPNPGAAQSVPPAISPQPVVTEPAPKPTKAEPFAFGRVETAF